MERSRTKRSRSGIDAGASEEKEYLPPHGDDGCVSTLQQAISICDYFVSEKKPEDGLAILVDFLSSQPGERRAARIEGKRRLETKEPEIAALLFRAVLETEDGEHEARTEGFYPDRSANEDEVLEELDSPVSDKDLDFIETQSREKRSIRVYDFDAASKEPSHEVHREPIDPPVRASRFDAPHQEDLLDLDDFSVPLPSLERAELSEQLGFSDLDEQIGDLDDSDWIDDDELAAKGDDSPYATEEFDAEVDWEQYIEDTYEFDEEPTREDLDEVATTERITREQRCTQQAIELATRFDWDTDGMELLRDIFLQYSWGAAKAALIRQLESDVTPSELRLAHSLRIFWAVTPEFSLSFGKYPHFILSWPLAIEIIRSYRGEPDLSEIEHFLWSAYDIWYSTGHLRRGFPSFRDYVKARINVFHNDQICSNAVDWTNGIPTSAFELDAIDDDLNNSPKVSELRSLGLMPTPPTSIAGRVGITKYHEDVETWATPEEYNVRLDNREAYEPE